ncbi:transcriptional regulator [Companilactobacillus sp. RD055328]|uniref:PadR family transcriptional regulator n=1 Tax=Companilactobacillus sp. RD055328 TaxID=2916634 RepID=UPI001FC7C901|nr:PadR family transcriptional regulator [Companilactobacillus sp. RD055328]GKQ43215.1 transcriptional regulator [Companilactobacillus sp. RD055328]
MAIQIPSEILDGSMLAFLTKEDLYGYTLTQKFQEKFDISESTIYPVLRRLKKDGYLETYDQPFQGRNRRYYKITEDGSIRLKEIQKDWLTFMLTTNDILEEKDD